jgi:predicted regulator of Ras-like GTPase activity (Roadblock/LC7/MglB family)
MSAALLNIGSRSVAELDRGLLEKVIVSGSKGDVVLTGVGGEEVLSAITRPGANLGLVLVEMKRCVSKLGQSLKA